MKSLKTVEIQFDKTDGIFLAVILAVMLAAASYNHRERLIDCPQHQAEKVEKLKQSL